MPVEKADVALSVVTLSEDGPAFRSCGFDCFPGVDCEPGFVAGLNQNEDFGGLFDGCDFRKLFASGIQKIIIEVPVPSVIDSVVVFFCGVCAAVD